MKEEKDILNRDVEIPEVVFRKADAALNQIRTFYHQYNQL